MLRPASLSILCAVLVVSGSAVPGSASPITAYGINFVPENLSTYAHRFAPKAGSKAGKMLNKRLRKEDRKGHPGIGLKMHRPEKRSIDLEKQ